MCNSCNCRISTAPNLVADRRNFHHCDKCNFDLCASCYQKQAATLALQASYPAAAKKAGMLAIWAFCIIGTLQSVGHIIVTFFGVDLSLNKSVKWPIWSLWPAIDSVLNSWMGLANILCFINMIFISRLPEVSNTLKGERRFQSVNCKFGFNRFLLIVMSWQPRILRFILAVDENGKSKLLLILGRFGVWPTLERMIDHASRGKIAIQLWNTTLLCFWCCFVAFGNCCWMWADVPENFYDIDNDDTQPATLEEPLLKDDAVL